MGTGHAPASTRQYQFTHSGIHIEKIYNKKNCIMSSNIFNGIDGGSHKWQEYGANKKHIENTTKMILLLVSYRILSLL